MQRASSLLLAGVFLGAVFLPTATAHGPTEAFAGQPADVRTLLHTIGDEVSGQNVYDCIDEFTKAVPAQYRLMGTPTQQLFLDWYGDSFEKLGLKSAIQEFSDRGPGLGVSVPTGGKNVIAVYPGLDLTKWVVIGGHYDTREGTIGGGAHDNASGTCTTLEIARAIAEVQPVTEASYVFAWWDGEEWGLYGSSHFANDHDIAKELLGIPVDTEVDMISAISVDMAGLVYPARNPWASGSFEADAPYQHFHLRAPPVTVEDTWACWSYGCYEELKEREDFDEILAGFHTYRDVVEETWREALQVPEEHVSFEEDRYGRTDHIPFMAKGIPGLRVQGAHDSEYPCYHHPCDTLEFMEFSAGSKEALIAGMDNEAKATAMISTFLAARGHLLPLEATLVEAGDALDATPDAPEVPGFGAGLLTLALLGAAAVFARRRD